MSQFGIALLLHLMMPDRKVVRPVFICVKLDLDRTAFDLPIVEGQANLTVCARIVPSSVRSGWDVEGLFDNLGDTAWDPDGDNLTSALDFDLGQVQCATRRVAHFRSACRRTAPMEVTGD